MAAPIGSGRRNCRPQKVRRESTSGSILRWWSLFPRISWCIRATAYGALDRGYDLTLIKDAHTTETMELENGVRIEAANVIHELNIAMTWLSYPGRANGTVLVEELDFATLGDGS